MGVEPARPALPIYPVPSQRGTAYAYQCNNCKRCCHNKLIQVNPYEAVRLASHLGVSTGEFARDCLDDNVFLKRTPDGACIFLGEGGCSVHPHRPLVCRIYPLGRHVAGSGGETFTHFAPHPQSAGEYGHDKTIEDYLLQQGAIEYMAAADRYLELFHRLHALLRASLAKEPELAKDLGPAASAAKTAMPAWLDVDSVVASYCNKHSLPQPETMDAKMQMHITAIDSWLEQQASENPAPSP